MVAAPGPNNTSGTTGAKGTMLTHRNLIDTAKNAVAREGLSATDEVVAYLPNGMDRRSHVAVWRHVAEQRRRRDR